MPTLTAKIDLNALPTLPFDGAIINQHVKGGEVTIEKRPEGVFIDGKKLTTYRSERQIKGEKINGHELLLEVERLPTYNAALSDFFEAHPEFVPEELKLREGGEIIYVHFWKTLFDRPSGDRTYVVCGFWEDDRWKTFENRLGARFAKGDVALVSED